MFKFLLKRGSRQKQIDLRVVNKNTSFLKAITLMAPGLIILMIFTIIPFISTMKDAFHDYTGTGPITTSSFKEVLADKRFTQGITNSILYAIISVPLILIISVIISSSIASVVRKRRRGFLQTIFFLPYITSAIAISLAFVFIFDYDTGLLNKIIKSAGGKGLPWLSDTEENSRSALWAMLIYGVWRGLAFNILIFTTAMLSVNKTLYKSASIDGAGPIRQFFSITLPSIRRTSNFLLIMGIIGAIKVFPLALFNNDTGEAFSSHGSTLMLFIYHMTNAGQYDLAGASAILLVGISLGYAIVFKGGVNQTLKLVNWLGEKRVSNKIKNTNNFKQ